MPIVEHAIGLVVSNLQCCLAYRVIKDVLINVNFKKLKNLNCRDTYIIDDMTEVGENDSH